MNIIRWTPTIRDTDHDLFESDEWYVFCCVYVVLVAATGNIYILPINLHQLIGNNITNPSWH